MISSNDNPQVRHIQMLMKKGKLRREEHLLVAEGVKLCQEIPLENLTAVYVAESFCENPAFPGIRRRAERVSAPLTVLSDRVFSHLSDTVTPQGVLGLVHWENRPLSSLLCERGTLLLAEDVQDPGNLGTMLRVAEGAGVRGVICSPHTVDFTSPKVVRSTMGSVLRLPICVAEDWLLTLRLLKKAGFSLFGAHLKGTVPYDAISYPERTGILIGNEAHGLSPESAEMCDRRIVIPMEGKVESLNAAVAAAILLYEVYRQKRAGN